eukprot:1889726-Pleurochrysis_carterae.AAC.1
MLAPRLKFQGRSDPESADAEPLEEEGASFAPPCVRWTRAVDEYEKRWEDMPAGMEAMEARTTRI